jgi:hypothetical protein
MFLQFRFYSGALNVWNGWNNWNQWNATSEARSRKC